MLSVIEPLSSSPHHRRGNWYSGKLGKFAWSHRRYKWQNQVSSLWSDESHFFFFKSQRSDIIWMLFRCYFYIPGCNLGTWGLSPGAQGWILSPTGISWSGCSEDRIRSSECLRRDLLIWPLPLDSWMPLFDRHMPTALSFALKHRP